mmetsp:Transcript_30334/g.61858  ORF Transcript_30334/g.61858 Transcript_30334/m.61858 type:complete len:105 (-) Transcript_30334:487-801(-)
MKIADMTITRATNKEVQSRIDITSLSYVNLAYNNKFKGSIKTESIVDTAVMVTESAKSALNNEHHQFEYEPPGELVTTNKLMPIAWFKSSAFTTANPKKGRKKN